MSALTDLQIRPKRMPSRPADEALFSRATATWLEGGGPRIRVWSWGDAALPTTLLVHGWSGRGAQLAPFVEPLLARGRHVVTFDSPAHGDSDGELSSVADVGRGVVRVAQSRLRIDETIAHSVGSAATLFAFAHGVHVRASVHIAGPSSLDRMIGYVSRALELSPEAIAESRAEIEAQMKVAIADLEPSALRAGFDHPALLLHDRGDREVPFSESELLAAEWPAAKLVEVKGLGHRRVLEAPQIVEHVIAFLAALSP